MDVLVLIDKLDDLVHNAKPVPLTDQVRVDREEIYDLLDQMRATIPEEIKQARWIVKERQEMLAEAKRESERIIKEARDQQQRLVSQEEITKQAERAAEEIVEDANARAREIRLGAEDYADEILNTLEVNLQKFTAAVQRGRDRLAGPRARAGRSRLDTASCRASLTAVRSVRGGERMRRALFPVLTLAVLLVCAGVAEAAFPGQNGKIAFDRHDPGAQTVCIYIANADGSGQAPLLPCDSRSESKPRWSPDGSQIAYEGGALQLDLINADGSNLRPFFFESGISDISGARLVPGRRQAGGQLVFPCGGGDGGCEGGDREHRTPGTGAYSTILSTHCLRTSSPRPTGPRMAA